MSSNKRRTVNKRLPFNLKRLDLGSGKLRDRLKALATEWNRVSTPAARKREIERIYKACLRQWDRLKEKMASFGIHIGNLD